MIGKAMAINTVEHSNAHPELASCLPTHSTRDQRCKRILFQQGRRHATKHQLNRASPALGANHD
jgi:hypothetical protein